MNIAPHSIFPGLSLVVPNPNSHPLLRHLFHMTSLIKGWFLVRKKGEDDSLNLTNSRKLYLSIFNSLPSLGQISTEIYIDCELRLYPGPGGRECLEDQVIHAHGRFCINSTGEALTLQMEVHRFDIMAVGESIPDTLCPLSHYVVTLVFLKKPLMGLTNFSRSKSTSISEIGRKCLISSLVDQFLLTFLLTI